MNEWARDDAEQEIGRTREEIAAEKPKRQKRALRPPVSVEERRRRHAQRVAVARERRRG